MELLPNMSKYSSLSAAGKEKDEEKSSIPDQTLYKNEK